MHIPAHFRAEELAPLQQLMRDYSFATLVSTGEDLLPVATPLPFVVDVAPGHYGTLRAHMALGNPQWRTFREDREVLVIFQGPHAYITPSWYEQPLSVPTWNYATVHAYGRPRILKDASVLYKHLSSLVQVHEAQFATPWPFEQLPEPYVEKMMRGVVGFEIEITRLEGKFKMSQNRQPNERARVAEELHKSPDPASVATGTFVEDLLKRSEDKDSQA